MADTMNTAQVAEAFETDARTLRKFLRSELGEGKAVVGKGKRYSFDAKTVRTLRPKYAEWVAARAAAAEVSEDEVAETE